MPSERFVLDRQIRLDVKIVGQGQFVEFPHDAAYENLIHISPQGQVDVRPGLETAHGPGAKYRHSVDFGMIAKDLPNQSQGIGSKPELLYSNVLVFNHVYSCSRTTR